MHGLPPSPPSPPPPPLPKSAPPTRSSLQQQITDVEENNPTDSEEFASIISVTSRIIEIDAQKLIVIEQSEVLDWNLLDEPSNSYTKIDNTQETESKSLVFESAQSPDKGKVIIDFESKEDDCEDSNSSSISLDQSESISLCDYSYDFGSGIQSCSSMYDLSNEKSIFEELNEQASKRAAIPQSSKDLILPINSECKNRNNSENEDSSSDDSTLVESESEAELTEIIGNIKSNHILSSPQNLHEKDGILSFSLAKPEKAVVLKSDTNLMERKPSPKVNVILMPLQPIKSFRNGAAIFVCEVISKKVKVRWFKGEDQLFGSGDKYTVTVAGKMHSLTIHNLVLGDCGTYSVNCDGQISTAILEVRGK